MMTLYLGTSRRFAYKVSRVITDEQTCLGQALTKLVHMKSQVNHNRKLEGEQKKSRQTVLSLEAIS